VPLRRGSPSVTPDVEHLISVDDFRAGFVGYMTHFSDQIVSQIEAAAAPPSEAASTGEPAGSGQSPSSGTPPSSDEPAPSEGGG
jgi:hypothetical protein